MGALVYYVFDLLELEGERLLEWPLEERRALLESLVDETSATVRFSRGFTDGATLLRAAREQGLEGWSPSASAPATSRAGAARTGGRSRSGAGSPSPSSVDRGERSRERLGSLVLGAATDDGDLVWVGHVGSGLARRRSTGCWQRLTPLARATSPLDRRERDPRLRRGRVTWVEPELRALVEFSEWTDEGRVRAPVYHGLVDATTSLPACLARGSPRKRASTSRRTTRRRPRR
jgi:bifunctional non-homologous end joining protein LigD